MGDLSSYYIIEDGVFLAISDCPWHGDMVRDVKYVKQPSAWFTNQLNRPSQNLTWHIIIYAWLRNTCKHEQTSSFGSGMMTFT